MDKIQKKSGRYLGTRIEHKWWQRYTEAGFVTRGSGQYWIMDGSLFFQHHASQEPFRLPLRNLAEIKICPCRRRTGGIPIIRLVWEKDGCWLNSGFVLSGLVEQGNHLLTSLRSEGPSA